MSLPPNPDEPTRRLPPTERVAPPPAYEREVVATASDDYVWREEVIDRLGSLRTAVVLIGILAVAALGVALWALLTQEEEGDARRGASLGQVRDLNDRVDQLEQDLDRTPSRDAVSQLSKSVDSLDERVATLEDSVDAQGSSEQAVADVQGDVQQLSDAIEQLDQRVQAVEASSP
jgi:outer membrane murein-binding lipoprotein Lpp